MGTLTRIRLNWRIPTRMAVFGDEVTEPLLEADTLEGLGLAVDPANPRLVPIERFPMAPHPSAQQSVRTPMGRTPCCER